MRYIEIYDNENVLMASIDLGGSRPNVIIKEEFKEKYNIAISNKSPLFYSETDGAITHLGREESA